MENRLERFVQDCMETARHVAQIFVEYKMEAAGGGVRWAHRRILEEQMQWSAARQRFGELCSRAAFNLVVEAGVRAVAADAGDMEHEAQQPWTLACAGKTLKAEAERLKENVRHLQQHVELLRGAPGVANLQNEMQQLVRDYLQNKVQNGEHAAALQNNDRGLYTTAVAFLSRELPEPVQ